MCLDAVATRLWGDEPECSGIGYQVMRHDMTSSPHKPRYKSMYCEDRVVAVGVEYEASQVRLRADRDCRTYLSGFHIWLRREDAEAMLSDCGGREPRGTVVEVAYRGGETRGVQYGNPVVVAKWRTILREVDAEGNTVATPERPDLPPGVVRHGLT